MRKITTIAALFTASLASAALQYAPAEEASEQRTAQYVNTYIELMPESNQAGEQTLDRYAAYARSQPGVVSFELLRLP